MLFRLQESFTESALNLHFVIVRSLKRSSLMRSIRSQVSSSLWAHEDLSDKTHSTNSKRELAFILNRVEATFLSKGKKRDDLAEYFYSRSSDPFSETALDVIRSIKVLDPRNE